MPPGDALLEAQIDTLLEGMELEEKVAQLHGTQMAPVDDLYVTHANPRLKIGPFKMVDGPRGVRAGQATAFPVPVARGASFNPQLEAQVGEAIGAEVRAKGGNVLLAPTINVLRHPSWGRAQETYGEDPVHIGAMGAAFVRGAQRQVVACAKHFAANSIENTRFKVDVRLDERVLREVYLPQFRDCVRQGGVASVMAAYNKVNGEYASQHAHLLKEILRDEWGFDGLVMSDWLFGTHDTEQAIRAGLDVEMPNPKIYGAPLVEAVDDGRIDESLVDEAVRRVLRIKLRFGIGDFAQGPAEDPVQDVVECAAHRALALEAARQGCVLLRNENETLPLRRDQLRRVALIGPLEDLINLGDTGSSAVRSGRVVTVREGLEKLAGGLQIDVLDHDSLDGPSHERLARADAVVVVVGLTAANEGEGLIATGDRTDLGLPEGQDALVLEVLKHNPRTIVVLQGGGALLTEQWIEQVPALLMAWYPGVEGGRAIAELLFGDISPSGKLPVSFARDSADLPDFDNRALQVHYGMLHGYSHLDATARAPRFCFGHGLAYTRFEWRDLQLSARDLAPDAPLEVSLTLANVGERIGTEVVQLYLGMPGSRVQRAARLLRAFERVVLQPGESREIHLTLWPRDLAFFDPDRQRWWVEPGDYLIEVGASSRDLKLHAKVCTPGGPVQSEDRAMPRGPAASAGSTPRQGRGDSVA